MTSENSVREEPARAEPPREQIEVGAATRFGSASELRSAGRLLGKIGSLPVLVAVDGDEVFAIEDRCPHLGFPLHQGSIESGMVTCHWHHARFDLASGCTLDPWADDAIGFRAEIVGDDVWVRPHPAVDPVERLTGRLRVGLEQQLTIVTAKAILGLCEHPAGEADVLRTVIEFGLARGGSGWGAGLTVAACLGRVLDALDAADRPLALIVAATWVAGDVAGERPRIELGALPDVGQPVGRLTGWYRRFVETRSADGAERSLATAIAGGSLVEVEQVMFAALTDHVFVDTGHSLDFTNKAIESLGWLPADTSVRALTSLVAQTCRAERSEELSAWHHPDDLAAIATGSSDLAQRLCAGRPGASDETLEELAAALLSAAPAEISGLIDISGATAEQAARAVAHAAALRMVRFHTSNDVADWNTVHHTFTFTNAVHQAVRRHPTPEVARAIVHGALRVHLDRFLNVPAARLTTPTEVTLDALDACWDRQGAVDDAGSHVVALCAVGRQDEVTAALGRAMLREDSEFHVVQAYEAAVSHAAAWLRGSKPAAHTLAAFARFLAAYCPTRRERATIVRTAERLRRGDDLTVG